MLTPVIIVCHEIRTVVNFVLCTRGTKTDMNRREGKPLNSLGVVQVEAIRFHLSRRVVLVVFF